MMDNDGQGKLERQIGNDKNSNYINKRQKKDKIDKINKIEMIQRQARQAKKKEAKEIRNKTLPKQNVTISETLR